MRKRYLLVAGSDISLTLEVDALILTEDMARQIVDASPKGGDVLLVSGDIFEAVCRLAAEELIPTFAAGWDSLSPPLASILNSSFKILSKIPSGGITIISSEFPDIKAEDFDVEPIIA